MDIYVIIEYENGKKGLGKIIKNTNDIKKIFNKEKEKKKFSFYYVLRNIVYGHKK